MQNESRKRAFLEGTCNSELTRNQYWSMFRRLALFEDSWKHDICESSEEEINAVLNRFSMTHHRSNYSLVSLLQRYIKWCDKQGYNTTYGLFQIKFDELAGIRTTMVSNPAQLEVFLNNAYINVENMLTADATFRCYHWLAYAGIPHIDAFAIRSGEIDLDDMSIRHNGIVYPIYREGLKVFRQCATSKKIRSYRIAFEEISDRPDSDLLLRTFNDCVDQRSLSSIISKKNRDALNAGLTSLKPTYQSLVMSGAFYNAMTREQAGIDIDFEELAKFVIAGTQYHGKKNKLEFFDKYKKHYVYECKLDYERWKLAFYS